MFLDSDDTWLPGKVRRQVELLQDAGPSVPCCISNAILRDADGSEKFSFDVAEIRPPMPEGIWTNPAEVLASRFLFFNQVAAIRRQALLACNGFDERLKLLEDWDLALRLSAGSSWVYTAEPFAVWNPGSNESLVTQAAKDRVVLCESALLVHQKALDSSHHPAELLRGKIRSARRELLALRLKSSASLWKRGIGNSISFSEHCRTALLKRSACYPQMKVQKLQTKPVLEYVTV